ncbi:MAG: hypothetical protein ABI947_14100 [Chloroflexota bacterium]
MKAFYRWLDNSTGLKDLIKALSATLAARRGLPLIGAVVLTLVSLVVHLLAAISGSVWISICGFSILHLAILIGFLGILLAEPLGRG